MSRGPRTTEHKNITRIDHHVKRTFGYNVRIAWKGQKQGKFFSDGMYGTPEAALAAAIAWRDKTEKTLGKPRTEHQIVGFHTRNNTGNVGIRRRKRGSVEVYEATWIVRDEDGNRKRQTTCFSIARHGEKKAFNLARKAREQGERSRMNMPRIRQESVQAPATPKPLGQFKRNLHYKLIAAFYGDRRAERSGVPYIQHIDEGLVVLEVLGAAVATKEAYCLHPIVQSDSDLQAAITETGILTMSRARPTALVLAMEYRWIANLYLSDHVIHDVAEIRLSPLAEVQHMLIADKVQNRKDFERYHQATHPRSAALTHYFQQWLTRLGVDEEQYQALVAAIEAAYPVVM